LITVINDHHACDPTHAIPLTPAVSLELPNHPAGSCANVTKPHIQSIQNTKKDKTFTDNFFIFFMF
jgi:hypothetical protein